jgi:hypothetical protein
LPYSKDYEIENHIEDEEQRKKGRVARTDSTTMLLGSDNALTLE